VITTLWASEFDASSTGRIHALRAGSIRSEEQEEYETVQHSLLALIRLKRCLPHEDHPIQTFFF
jgi:hypothetical protein